jgi:alpha-L-rhamnosidase
MQRSVACALVAAILTIPAFAGSKLLPANLRCEYRVDPLGIDETQPRLSWTLESAERGQMQTAYRVLIASDPSLLSKNRGDLWDSGKVESSRSVLVVYAGNPLQSQMRCFWKVRAWEKDDRQSPWSRPGFDDSSWDKVRAAESRGESYLFDVASFYGKWLVDMEVALGRYSFAAPVRQWQ